MEKKVNKKLDLSTSFSAIHADSDIFALAQFASTFWHYSLSMITTKNILLVSISLTISLLFVFVTTKDNEFGLS